MKKAFTLAEVLIVLGVIGLVVMITMPTVIANHQKKVIESGVKEAYNILSQAIQASILENGEPNLWFMDVDNTEYVSENYILPYLKVIKKCGISTSSRAIRGCFPTVNGQYNMFYTLDGALLPPTGYSPQNFYSCVLSNGMILGIRKDYNTRGTSDPRHFITFAVDVNGHRGKNTLGKDIFMYTLAINYKGKNYKFATGNKNNTNMHIEYSDEKLKTDKSIKGICNPTAPSGQDWLPGAACSVIIQRNGWQIPDDYPAKL